MAIGSLSDLYNSSQGKMAPRVATPPKPILEQSRISNWQASDLATAQSALGNPTSTYNKVVSTPATGGLTEKGKYGGFYSASDQQSAIEGGALNLRENVAPALMAKAEAFYKKLDPMYGEASKGPSRFFMKPGMSQLPSVDERKWENINPNGYIAKIVNPSRQYANQLNDWYATQAKPAQEYNATAMQIQSTPLSQLASQIATSAYGMNSDLATSKFSGLDAKYFKEQEDASAMAATQQAAANFAASSKENAALNIPASGWKAYKATEAENAKAAAAIPKKYQTALQDVVGYRASDLESATGQTSQQLYSYLSPQYSIKDPDTSSIVSLNGATIVDKMNKYISSGDDKAAKAMIDGLVADPTAGTQDLVKILNAMFKLGRANQKKSSDAVNTIMGE